MTHASDRREFLKTATGAVCAGMFSAGPLADAAAVANQENKDQPVNSQADLPIVDTHEHLWDLSKFNLPWTKDNPELGKSFVTKDYLAATHGLHVVKSVYMEVDVEPSQQVQEAEYVIDLCQRKDNPMVGAVISGRPATEEFRAYIMKYKDIPYIKGVRPGTARALEPGWILPRQANRQKRATAGRTGNELRSVPVGSAGNWGTARNSSPSARRRGSWSITAATWT